MSESFQVTSAMKEEGNENHNSHRGHALRNQMQDRVTYLHG